MNKKLKPTLLAIALATSFGTNAVVYKIENINEFYKVNGTINNSRSGFGVTLNSTGNMIGGASGVFSSSLSTDDQDLIRDNNIDISSDEVSISAANSSTNITRSVKFIPQANNSIFQFDNELIPEFLTVFDETITSDSVTVSTIDSFAFDISDNNVIVGTTSSAAFAVADPDQSEDNTDRDLPFYTYDYGQRAMIIDNGEVKTFIPEFSEFGGQSGLTGINASGYVVGYASTGIEYLSQLRIDELCLDDYVDSIPLQVCARGFSHENESSTTVRYYLEAHSWEYVNGQLTNPTPLGILTTPIDDDDTDTYNSFALDVNDLGVAVGRSKTFRDNEKEVQNRLDVAVVFKDGEIIDLMDHDEDDWINSSANAINDNNLAVGFMEKIINGFLRAKFFVYDVNSDEPALEFPNDFASSESDFASIPNDINNLNQVVGSIEIDNDRIQIGRRTHAFLYDHDDQSFSDINDLLTCESQGYVKVGDNYEKFQIEATGGDETKVTYEADISVVNARAISDDGTIMATALVRVPNVETQWIDEDGNIVEAFTTDAVEEIVVDANGDPIFETTAAGEVVTEQVQRAVILTPVVDGEECVLITEDSQEFKETREGAGFGFTALCLLIGGLFTRRLRR